MSLVNKEDKLKALLKKLVPQTTDTWNADFDDDDMSVFVRNTK